MRTEKCSDQRWVTFMRRLRLFHRINAKQEKTTLFVRKSTGSKIWEAVYGWNPSNVGKKATSFLLWECVWLRVIFNKCEGNIISLCFSHTHTASPGNHQLWARTKSTKNEAVNKGAKFCRELGKYLAPLEFSCAHESFLFVLSGFSLGRKHFCATPREWHAHAILMEIMTFCSMGDAP